VLFFERPFGRTFEAGFKVQGLLPVGKREYGFDSPGFIIGCVGDLTVVVGFYTGFKIFCKSGVVSGRGKRGNG
jgi:hypothetical protein